MDWKTFVVRLVEALVWPGVVAWVYWVSRNQIGALIGRLTKLKWKDAEAAFSEKLDRVESALAAPETAEDLTADDLSARVAEAQLPPAYVIMNAWMRVETAVRKSLEQVGIPSAEEMSLSPRLPQFLTSALKLSKDEAQSVLELRFMRNIAAHNSMEDITPADALRYHDIAERLVRRIEGHTG